MGASRAYTNQLAQSFAAKLERIEAWFQRQRRYAFISSSLLFVYDAQAFQRDMEVVVNGHASKNGTDSCNSADGVQPNENHDDHSVAGSSLLCEGLNKVCDVRMIDFAHVLKTENVDDNYLGGLQHLLALFRDVAGDANRLRQCQISKV